MAMEVRLLTEEGERIYREGVREITNGDEKVWLAFGEEDEGTAASDVLTGDSESFPGATIEVVKLEGGQSIEEQDKIVGEFVEE